MKNELNLIKIIDIQYFIESIDSIEYKNEVQILTMEEEFSLSGKDEKKFEKYLKDRELIGGTYEDIIGLDMRGNPIYQDFKNAENLEDYIKDTEPSDLKIDFKHFILEEQHNYTLRQNFDIFKSLGAILNPKN